MGWEANVPSGFWAKVQKLIDDSIAKALRGGPLRNATISGGAGLTIKDGGILQLQTAGGAVSFYVGPLLPSKADGTGQQGLVLRREDGSLAMALYDPNPLDNFRQFLALYDRAGNIIVSDDTESGQGLARPYVGGQFYRTRTTDWIGTTATSWDALFRAKLPKQHPQLFVRAWGVNSVSGATGQVRVMVNGVQLGVTQSTSFSAITEFQFGPAPVAGAHMSELVVEIQAQMVSGTGMVQIEPSSVIGQQS